MSEAEPNRAIKDYVTKEGSDWKHRDTVTWLYKTFDTYRFAFFSPQDETQLEMPQAVIAVDQMRHDTLAAYRLTYNPNGLPFEIIMNSLWIERPRWELGETLLHESVHLYQEYMSDRGQNHNGKKLQGCKSGWHNKDFVDIANQVGLHPLPGIGAHYKPGDGQFARLMEILEVEKPEHAKGEFKKPEDTKKADYWWSPDRGRKQGRSTLTLYTSADCSLPAPCKLRSGRKDLHLSCKTCGGDFAPQLS